ncbi:phospholipid/glycerol acyltransferase [Streptococcus parauberis]|nr:phospholipid/glycerol acyltransferase [Streptococcus parauberis]
MQLGKKIFYKIERKKGIVFTELNTGYGLPIDIEEKERSEGVSRVIELGLKASEKRETALCASTLR